VTIPANTTATVAMPAQDMASVYVDGRQAEKAHDVKFTGMNSGAAEFEVPSGTYEFETK